MTETLEITIITATKLYESRVFRLLNKLGYNHYLSKHLNSNFV